MSVSFQSFWVEGAGNTTEIQTLLTLALLLYALQILPLLVRPNLNKFAPSNITNSPPSISGRSQSFTSFPDKTSYETNSRIHFDGGEFAIGRNFHRPKQLNKNEITEAIGGLFSGEKGELFVVCLEMKHEPPKTNTTKMFLTETSGVVSILVLDIISYRSKIFFFPLTNNVSSDNLMIWGRQIATNRKFLRRSPLHSYEGKNPQQLAF